MEVILLLMLAFAAFIFWPTEVIKNTWHNTIILYRNTPRKGPQLWHRR